jgi:hypothetical protein
MFFSQTNVCASERTPHAPSPMLKVAGQGFAELLRNPTRRSSVAFISTRGVYRKGPFLLHVCILPSEHARLLAFSSNSRHVVVGLVTATSPEAHLTSGCQGIIHVPRYQFSRIYTLGISVNGGHSLPILDKHALCGHCRHRVRVRRCPYGAEKLKPTRRKGNTHEPTSK